jgi:hypothetical protein
VASARRVSTAARWRRKAAEPWQSPVGSVAAAASAPAARSSSSSGCSLCSAASASRARIGRRCTPQSAMRACAIAPSSSSVTTAATPHIGSSPWRRDSSTNADPTRCAAIVGIRSATASSSGWSALVKGPVKKSSASITRSPRVLRATTWPSRASSAVGSSADGSANATLPTAVPRCRTDGWATCPTASANSGAPSRTCGDVSQACWRATAPIRSTPSSVSMADSASIRLMSITTDGVARRVFINRTRL